MTLCYLLNSLSTFETTLSMILLFFPLAKFFRSRNRKFGSQQEPIDCIVYQVTMSSCKPCSIIFQETSANVAPLSEFSFSSTQRISMRWLALMLLFFISSQTCCFSYLFSRFPLGSNSSLIFSPLSSTSECSLLAAAEPKFFLGISEELNQLLGLKGCSSTVLWMRVKLLNIEGFRMCEASGFIMSYRGRSF